VALLGTYPPRLCGLATFSENLADHLRLADPNLTVDIFAMDDGFGYDYGTQLTGSILPEDEASYLQAADQIRRGRYDVLSIQHEYGIFGGAAGERLLTLMRRVDIPMITTLHTVLREPTPSQKRVMDEVLELSSLVIVMSSKAIDLLLSVHGCPEEKIRLIHHGIPEVTPADGAKLRTSLDAAGPLLLTFGLIAPDKGIEYVIQAMPEILRDCPGAHYCIVGATHPHVLAHHGEEYRRSLKKLALDLEVASSVQFVDRFVSSQELVQWLSAADVYITPYLKPSQITSGTLAYAAGAGKAVISTPYWYAEELIGEDRGIIVPFRDAKAIAEAVIRLESDHAAREAMGAAAAAHGRLMHWPVSAGHYLSAFTATSDKASEPERWRECRSPQDFFGQTHALELSLTHLEILTDDTGIIQHADYTIPNRSEGYCVDDNARALIFTLLYEGSWPEKERLSLAQSRYLSFVLHAYNAKAGRMRNFMSYDRQWLEDVGSEDSHGRSLWSLGETVRRGSESSLRDAAGAVFRAGLPALLNFTSPRAWAYGILGCEAYLAVDPGSPLSRHVVSELGSRLYDLWGLNAGADWPWFEQSLSYANPRAAQALLAAGTILGSHQMEDTALKALEWLARLQTSATGQFSPVGSLGLRRGEDKGSAYDQQPIEAWSSLSASLSAYRHTGSTGWLVEADRAFRWFFGDNAKGMRLCDPRTGGCADGLHSDRISRNQGAESTLAYLCSVAEMKAVSPALPARLSAEFLI
jgi:glycosyltransferase involved in cell wall biosynthesis